MDIYNLNKYELQEAVENFDNWNHDINRVLESFDLNGNSIFFDIGTNVGEELEVLLPTGAEVHSFEPHPVLAEFIRKRFENYNNLVFNECAAWIKNENKTFFYKRNPSSDAFNDAGSTLIKSKTNISGKWSSNVRCIDISEYVFNLKKQIDVMKIDVEGAEYHVIKHLIDTGAIEKISNLLFEDHQRKIPRGFIEFYNNKKYVLDRLDSLSTKFGLF